MNYFTKLFQSELQKDLNLFFLNGSKTGSVFQEMLFEIISLWTEVNKHIKSIDSVSGCVRANLQFDAIHIGLN